MAGHGNQDNDYLMGRHLEPAPNPVEREQARDAGPKMAPVQGYAPGIPWALHLEAYEVYSKKWAPQPALIDLEGRNCRGGFHVTELDEFIPGWRERATLLASGAPAAAPAGKALRWLTDEEVQELKHEWLNSPALHDEFLAGAIFAQGKLFEVNGLPSPAGGEGERS